jgi:hypothetical protein
MLVEVHQVVAQQKPTSTKAPAGRTSGSKETSKAQTPQRVRPGERYTMKPEFWDGLLDSIPPWGDEIAAIVLIVFGIVSFLSLLNVSADATISTAWSNALKTLFGAGSVVVSGGILGLGIVILLPKLGIVVTFPTRRILALEIGFLSILAILHLASGDSELRALARAGQGGGYIGWALSATVSGLFGSLTAIIFYGMLLIISVGVVLGARQSHLKGWVQKTSQRLRSYGEKYAHQPVPVSAPVSSPISAATAALEGTPPLAAVNPAQAKRTTAQIMRIRPDLENVPPSQRPGALSIQLKESSKRTTGIERTIAAHAR